MDIQLCGDSALSVCFGDVISKDCHKYVLSFKMALESKNINGIKDIIPSFTSVFISYDPVILSYENLLEIINSIDIKTITFSSSRIIEIPVCYDLGLDFNRVEAYTNLDKKNIIKLHCKPIYLVYMLGFVAGFPYLGGMDDKIATPRLESPRQSIQAGSVGIADKQTGVYPISTPGGWNIIGITPIRLYDPSLENPTLLKSGDKIKFIPIDIDEFNLINTKVNQGNFIPSIIEEI